MSYFQDIQDGIRTTLNGLRITLRHLRAAVRRREPVGVASANYFEQQNGLVTLQYPHEQLPIPDNGRYRLHNEIDDCIVCDKCAKVCPVDCITIDAIKATEEVGRASDGSPIRLYAAKFDIDMAKCCYCGLCTVVCPTECLTMEKTFDYSEYELGRLTYGFANLTPEEADEKRTLYEQFVREKEAQKAAQKAAAPVAEQGGEAAPTAKRPAFRPGDAAPGAGKPAAKPAVPGTPAADEADRSTSAEQRSGEPDGGETTPDRSELLTEAAKPRPAFRPTQRPAAAPNSTVKEARKAPEDQNSAGSALAHPTTDATPDDMEQIAEAGRISVGLSPDADTVTQQPVKQGEATPEAGPVEPAGKPKPAFRPTMKPPTANPNVVAGPSAPDKATPNVVDGESAAPAKPRPAFRPTMKPTNALTDGPNERSEAIANPDTPTTPAADTGNVVDPAEAVAATPPAETPRPKPAFRPTMKPKPAAPGDVVVNDATTLPTNVVGEPAETPPAEAAGTNAAPAGKSKPAFRPTMKPKAPDVVAPAGQRSGDAPAAERSDAAQAEIRSDTPEITSAERSGPAPQADETPVSKPAFRPTMKPKANPSAQNPATDQPAPDRD